jgi:hypothetical protein
MRTILLLSLLVNLISGGAARPESIPIHVPTGMQWVWAVLGVVIYEAAFFVMATDELDGTKKRFNYKKYKDDNWPNWFFALLCVPITVVFGEQIWYYLMNHLGKDWVFMDVLFLLSGPLADGIFWGLKKIKIIVNSVKSNSSKT